MQDNEFEFEEEENLEGKPEEDNKSEPEEKPNEEETKSKKQSSKLNAYYKERRLEQQQEKDPNREAYVKGKIDALKVNSFTGESINNERDLQIFEAMKQAENEGKEPISGGYKIYLNSLEEKEAKAREEIELDKKKQETLNRQYDQFKKAIPDLEERNALLANQDFKEMYEYTIENGGDLGKCAIAFKKMRSNLEKEAEIKIKSKKMALQPSSEDGDGGDDTTSISKMSDEKIAKLFKERFGA